MNTLPTPATQMRFFGMNCNLLIKGKTIGDKTIAKFLWLASIALLIPEKIGLMAVNASCPPEIPCHETNFEISEGDSPDMIQFYARLKSLVAGPAPEGVTTNYFTRQI